MQRFWIILLSINLLNNSLFACDSIDSTQDMFNWRFYDFLTKNDLHEEALTWLAEYPAQKRDSITNNRIYLEMARHFFILNKPALSQSSLLRISAITDSSVLDFAVGMAFITMDTAAVKTYISKYAHLMTAEEQMIVILSLKMIKEKRITTADIPPGSDENKLTKTANEYLNHKKKRPLTAGILSVLLPGAGKYYLGYKRQAFSGFVMNASLGLVAAECLLKSTYWLRWAIPIPITVVFYTGNILGSVLLAKKREVDFKNNIHEAIRNYFHSKLLGNHLLLSK